MFCIFYGIISEILSSIFFVQSLSHIQLFGTPWTIACQAPLPMGFSRQEFWSGLPFSSSRKSSQTRDWTIISCVSCIGRWVLYYWCHLTDTAKQISRVTELMYIPTSHACPPLKSNDRTWSTLQTTASVGLEWEHWWGHEWSTWVSVVLVFQWYSRKLGSYPVTYRGASIFPGDICEGKCSQWFSSLKLKNDCPNYVLVLHAPFMLFQCFEQKLVWIQKLLWKSLQI